ncbi:hypothetical protein [Streptomyces spinosus]|uniref:hypothetical protein n=1 Tax=Streptomyces spinosus TaxID=2872623 RepID=UPI001CEC9BE8|nr:hypothetical protein [Streptomyces spinosus]
MAVLLAMRDIGEPMKGQVSDHPRPAMGGSRSLIAQSWPVKVAVAAWTARAAAEPWIRDASGPAHEWPAGSGRSCPRPSGRRRERVDVHPAEAVPDQPKRGPTG